MSSELEDLIRSEERKFGLRAREREREANDLIFIDTRPQIAHAAMEREAARMWSTIKIIFWTGVAAVLAYGFILVILSQ